jgi:pimeloyl-ACP methyl ester carboxylesterase
LVPDIPSLENWRTSGDWLDVKGKRIFVKVVGDGKPLLLLHGFPTASYDYARLLPLLEDRYRLILFDFLGFGFSDKPRPYDYSLFEQAEIAEAVTTHFGFDSVYLLAHDMGASVALEILRRGKPKVEKLVLLNGSVLLDHYRPLLLQRLLLHPVIGPTLTTLRLVGRRGFGKQFGSVFAQRPPEAEIDAFWSLITYNDGTRIYDRLIQYLNERKIHQHTWLDALKNHPASLTVIWGQRDPVSVPAIAQAIMEHRPDARYVPLDDIGHFPQWEAPERVAATVKEAFG